VSGTTTRSAQPSGEADPGPCDQEEGEDLFPIESMRTSPLLASMLEYGRGHLLLREFQ
jgi:hypothetical protein